MQTSKEAGKREQTSAVPSGAEPLEQTSAMPSGAEPLEQASALPSDRDQDDGARDYWNGRSTSFGSFSGPNPYAETFIDYLGLEESQSVLDMGCAVGTLAVPLARRGHPVVACDFSPEMIRRLSEKVEGTDLPITPVLMAWEDDWDACGYGADCVDVAIASRSASFDDMSFPIRKLEKVARCKAAMTVPRGPLPLFEPCVMEFLGRKVPQKHLDERALAVLESLGRKPEVHVIDCERPMRFNSRETAVSELRHMAGDAPFDENEQWWFDKYAAEHIFETREGESTIFRLDYRLTVNWVFISWEVAR